MQFLECIVPESLVAEVQNEFRGIRFQGLDKVLMVLKVGEIVFVQFFERMFQTFDGLEILLVELAVHLDLVRQCRVT